MTSDRTDQDGLDAWDRTRLSLHADVDTICDAWPHAAADLDAVGWKSRPTRLPGAAVGDGTTDTPTGLGGHEGGGGGGELTSVEAAAEVLLTRASPAVAFIAEVGDVVSDLTRESRHPNGNAWTAVNSRGPMHVAVDALMRELPRGRTWPAGPLDMVRRVERLASAAARWWPRPPKKGDVVGGVTVGERGNRAQVCALCELPVVSGRDGNGRPLMRQDADGSAFHADCYYARKLTPLRAGRRKSCAIDGCEKPAHAKELCQSHYSRWIRTGVLGGSVGVT
jgi:hypothetical protein